MQRAARLVPALCLASCVVAVYSSPDFIQVKPSDDLALVMSEAPEGATILFSDGTYTPEMNGQTALLINKSVTLRASTPGQAVIDGLGQRRVVQILGGVVVLAGLNLTNGSNAFRGAGISITPPNEPSSTVDIIGCNVYANDCSGQGWGGGIEMYGVTVSIRNSSVHGNHGRFGGGMYIQTSQVVISGTVVSNNDAHSGAGIYIRETDTNDARAGVGAHMDMVKGAQNSVAITGGSIVANTAMAAGGGVWTNGGTTVIGVLIKGNQVPGGTGGGMYISNGGVDLHGCTILTNHAFSGGGIFVAMGTAVLLAESCALRGNVAMNGGGVHAEGGGSGAATFRACHIDGNKANADGGGAYVNGGSVIFSTSSISSNVALGSVPGSGGGGVYFCGGQLAVDGSIIEGNRAMSGQGGGVFGLDHSQPSVGTSSTVYNNTPNDCTGWSPLPLACGSSVGAPHPPPSLPPESPPLPPATTPCIRPFSLPWMTKWLQQHMLTAFVLLSAVAADLALSLVIRYVLGASMASVLTVVFTVTNVATRVLFALEMSWDVAESSVWTPGICGAEVAGGRIYLYAQVGILAVSHLCGLAVVVSVLSSQLAARTLAEGTASPTPGLQTLDVHKFHEHVSVYAALAILSSSNLQVLSLLPWKSRVFGGFPSARLLHMTHGTLVLGDVPQLALQLAFIIQQELRGPGGSGIISPISLICTTFILSHRLVRSKLASLSGELVVATHRLPL